MKITIEIPKDGVLDTLQVGSIVRTIGTIIRDQNVLMDQTRELLLASGTVVTWSTSEDVHA